MKNILVDTHCHLNFKDYDFDLDLVIKKSLAADVTKIVCVSSSLGDSRKSLAIAKKYPGIVYATVGIHPQQTDPENKKTIQLQVQELEELAKRPEVVAIGECGLDYSSASPPELDRTKEEQFYLFEKQIKIALKQNLPVCIHSRKATDNMILFLINQFNQSNQKLKGVWHCYSAGKTDIKKVQELGFYFGIDGNITYDAGLQNVVKEIPLEKIVLETDAPFLSPLPHRSLRNEPKNVKLIAEFIAKLKGVQISEVAEITSKNSVQLFKLI